MHFIFAFLLVFVAALYENISSFVLLFVPRQFRRRKDIRGQTVLITGAGSGLGRQLAIEFSKHATRLVLVDIDRKSLLQTEELLDDPSAALTYECDVSDYGRVYEMARRVREEAGDVDILVNNAGIVQGKHFMDLTEEKIVKTMEVNALAHFWTCKAFLPAMMRTNRGHLVSVASILGKYSCPQLTDYCASKFAALGFAEALELELRVKHLDGIKVTVVCPAHIGTGLFAGAKLTIGGILTPEYVAKEVLNAVLEEKEIIFLPHIFQYAVAVKELFSRSVVIKFYELIGFTKTMDNFTGRQSRDVSRKASLRRKTESNLRESSDFGTLSDSNVVK